jgi:thymidylate synthase ThyX
MAINVEILADTVWPLPASPEIPLPVRITTFRLEFWRAILPQVLTHRVFSRSTSSSRAQSSDKLKQSPYFPMFSREQKGMQGVLDFSDVEQETAEGIWDWAFEKMQEAVDRLEAMGVHRQHRNRLLEPFATCRMVVTATEWENFFALRCAPEAQPEIKALAVAMKMALQISTPRVSWLHLPYAARSLPPLQEFEQSAARCARVSYRNDTKTADLEADLRLAKRLWADEHKSPFEHQAVALSVLPSTAPQSWAYNLRGWANYRYLRDYQLDDQVFSGLCVPDEDISTW